MNVKKVINLMQWILGLTMISSIALFIYYSLERNFIMVVFVMMIIVIALIFKILLARKYYNSEEYDILGYVASYLSEIFAIAVIFIMATIEYREFGIVGKWFYAVLASILISRPLFFSILKKAKKQDNLGLAKQKDI